MNALKTALVSRLTGDATLLSILGTSTVQVFDKQAPQATIDNPAAYPYLVYYMPTDQTAYHMAGRSSEQFTVQVKAIDRGTSSKKAGSADERITELLHPNDPLVVPGWRYGFQSRIARIDFTETANGVVYQHVGGIYRFLLIPLGLPVG